MLVQEAQGQTLIVSSSKAKQEKIIKYPRGRCRAGWKVTYSNNPLSLLIYPNCMYINNALSLHVIRNHYHGHENYLLVLNVLSINERIPHLSVVVIPSDHTGNFDALNDSAMVFCG